MVADGDETTEHAQGNRALDFKQFVFGFGDEQKSQDAKETTSRVLHGFFGVLLVRALESTPTHYCYRSTSVRWFPTPPRF
mmetsp:Transcript_43103/g.58866  ORF Transcript_43103/g.58866 Transcript_43103/m.58866 type:complete len:80 (-) Transcript_43103:614-853(-)